MKPSHAFMLIVGSLLLYIASAIILMDRFYRHLQRVFPLS